MINNKANIVLNNTPSKPYKLIDGMIVTDENITVANSGYKSPETSDTPNSFLERKIKILPEMTSDEQFISMEGYETHSLWTPLPSGVIYQITMSHGYRAQDWSISVWWSKEPKGMRLNYSNYFKPISLNRNRTTFILADINMTNLTNHERNYAIVPDKDYWFNVSNQSGQKNGYSILVNVIERVKYDENIQNIP